MVTDARSSVAHGLATLRHGIDHLHLDADALVTTAELVNVFQHTLADIDVALWRLGR
jgi:hypothetical protein